MKRYIKYSSCIICIPIIHLKINLSVREPLPQFCSCRNENSIQTKAPAKKETFIHKDSLRWSALLKMKAAASRPTDKGMVIPSCVHPAITPNNSSGQEDQLKGLSS